MKIEFQNNNNHSLEHMLRCCKNFKALYLVFLILFLFNTFMTEAVII